jgi:LysM repeat protein
MKWRHWSILIVLLLLNYLIFSTAFTQLAQRLRPAVDLTRTPQPTFESANVTPLTWIILPTNTPRPTLAPPLVTLAAATVVTSAVTFTVEATSVPVEATAVPTLAPTQIPTSIPTVATATPEPTAQTVIHVVKSGETLGQIAQMYGVTVAAIMRANNLSNPNLIQVGQRLVIPVSGQPLPTAAPTTQAAATSTRRPPTPTPTPKPAATRPQFTAELIWRSDVAPNCGGPSISNLSIIRDAAGNPLNGVVVEVNCYGNVWRLNPSGKPGVSEPGHYDWSPGQPQPMDWICTARVVEINGQPVASSAEVSIPFDTNDCKPGGIGHQVAILNWTKNQ